MISSLRGKLIYSEKDFAVVECGGVGFRCNIGFNTFSKLPAVNSEIFLHTYMSVKEDAIDLFGFLGIDELECFKMLISVSGVGTKMGIALLSEFAPDKIMLCIATGDAKSLTSASGVGNKLAQRIVLELKDKVSSVSISNDNSVANIVTATDNSNLKEAVAALVTLGFAQSEATMAVGRLDQSLSTEDMIKGALKELSRRV
ncbi:MAG: Holliday junction branch migration protein RuvA [Ruminococcaceae bacterium]|nr:Holliday junction branch migration protein RuvA [Oscillospiraceae bacterium]